jgi:hypothetical protein
LDTTPLDESRRGRAERIGHVDRDEAKRDWR